MNVSQIFSRLEEQYDCQQTLDNLVPMWGPVLWQQILIQQQCLPEDPRGFSVWVQWKMWPGFIPNLDRSLSPSGYRGLKLLQNQSSAWSLTLSAHGGHRLAVANPAGVLLLCERGRTGSVQNSTLHPVKPGYHPNFQSSQAEAVIKPWRKENLDTYSLLWSTNTSWFIHNKQYLLLQCHLLISKHWPVAL